MKLTVLIFFMLFATNLVAQLPAIISNNMVLQQEMNVPLWGWISPNKKVSVTASWNNQKVETVSNNEGKFCVKLKTPKASFKSYKITIQCDTTVVLKNILIGEVWVCSGQSNMEMPMNGFDKNSPIQNAEQTIKIANFPNIRFFKVGKKVASEPQKNCIGEWELCTPQTARYFSALGFFFGRELYKNLNLPIGLIMSVWGGTPSESWTSADHIIKYDEFKEKVENVKSNMVFNSPTVLFNGMINPIIPFGIKGVIWYQGESNVYNADLYAKIFPEMVTCWREKWQQGEFPFYYVQIAPYNYKKGLNSYLLREVQTQCLKTIPNSAMAVTMDIGKVNNIHPPDKETVGKRLSYCALTRNYGKKNQYANPCYKSMKIEGDKIRIEFDNVSNGFVCKSKELNYFTIAGKDKVFVLAKAVIEKNTIVVSCEGIKEPLAVRFAWDNISITDLYNKEGLPVISFRTDDWKE